MNILLIEDDSSKLEVIKSLLIENGLRDLSKLVVAETLSSARREILTKIFDLIIFDFFLPNNTGDIPFDVSAELITEFESTKNYKTETIAITKFDLDDIDNIKLFNNAGVTVVHYAENNTEWRDSLKYKLKKASSIKKYDFLIFSALVKERNGFASTSAEVGNPKEILGMNACEIKIGTFEGLCLVPSAPGLVEMGVLASKAIEEFQPKVVAMNGICAGVEGRSKYLDLVVGKYCWEYQLGKIKGNKFLKEPYQVKVHPSIETDLQIFIENLENDSKSLKSEIYYSEAENIDFHFSPISSGSLVVEDINVMVGVAEEHRKMTALEMEMYALYVAARSSLCQPHYFGVKSVVDLGVEGKDDKFHSPACILSARFVTEFLSLYLPKIIDNG